MTGYLNLFLSILLFSFQFVFAKMYQKHSADSIVSQTAFVAAASVAGALLMLSLCRFSVRFIVFSFLLAVLFGIFSVLCDVSQLKALQLGSSAITTMFVMIGSIFLPFLFGVGFLSEKLDAFKIIALVLLCFIFLPEILSIRKSDRVGVLFLIFCLICFFTNGAISILSKIQADLKTALSANEFMFYSYTVCAAVTILFMAARRTKPAEIKSSLAPKPLLCAVGYSVCNCAGNIFSLNAAKLLPSSVQYPISSGCIVVVSALFYFLFFREKQSVLNILCMCISLLSILFFVL